MQRGRKPKPTHLKVVEGNPGHRPICLRTSPSVNGQPVKPKWLKGRGAALWDEVLGFVYWLTIADSYKLAAWCDRQADFEKNRKTWTAADRREHRSLGSELGLDPSSRARMGNDLRGATGGQKTNPKDAASKYFTGS
jgi:phage terminase small subunit